MRVSESEDCGGGLPTSQIWSGGSESEAKELGIDEFSLRLLFDASPIRIDPRVSVEIRDVILKHGFDRIRAFGFPVCYLNALPDSILLQIVSLLPIRKRISHISIQSWRLHRIVRQSICSVAFYKEDLDSLSDEQLSAFLKQYGSQISLANFDLYRSSLFPSQWIWRNSLTGVAKQCYNLRSLDIMFCDRHKVRDVDLIEIFKCCPRLTTLRIDAQFLNGHCLKFAPMGLRTLEMEMCCRLTELAFSFLLRRLRRLTTLHVSQLLILTDRLVAEIVRSLQQLTDVSIVSHEESVYEGLTGAGLAVISQLQRLKSLSVEGLSAVTDRFLSLISEKENPSFTSLSSLSLAFCFNISVHGLIRLSRLPNLQNLNLDGINRRNISEGVEKIAKNGTLVRLFLAERSDVSSESLVRIVKNSPLLRTLDISNNELIHNYSFGNEILSYWCAKFYDSVDCGRRKDGGCFRPLFILTDEHLPWNTVSKPAPDLCGRNPVTVVHVQREFVPEEELLPTTILSDESVWRLPSGLMAAHIRRGNRYRLVFSALGPERKPRLPISPTLNLDLSAFTASISSDTEDRSPEVDSASSPAAMLPKQYERAIATVDENSIWTSIDDQWALFFDYSQARLKANDLNNDGALFEWSTPADDQNDSLTRSLRSIFESNQQTFKKM